MRPDAMCNNRNSIFVDVDCCDELANRRVLDEVSVIVSTDHRELRGKDADDQHPISAITGLAEKLEELDAHVKDVDIHVTQQEKESWNNKSRIYRNASGALVISV